jgi:hypothetical protein
MHLLNPPTCAGDDDDDDDDVALFQSFGETTADVSAADLAKLKH